jgi:hypothetical protein
MSTDLPTSQKVKVTERLYLYGIGKDRAFEWDAAFAEESNYNRLDVMSTEAFF